MATSDTTEAASGVVDDAERDTTSPAKQRSIGARLLKWSLGIVVALGLLLVAAYFLIDSSFGKRFIVEQIAELEIESGLEIDIGRIEGSIYSEATLHDVSLSDPQGVFLRIPQVELDWRPLNWFSSGLDIRSAIAKRGVLLRVPELNETDSDSGFLPDFDIRVDRLALEQFTVAAGIAGDQARRIDLVGKARAANGQLYLFADSELGGEDRFFVKLDANPDEERFDAKVDIRAPRGGLIASLIGADADYMAKVNGSGSWSDWRGGAIVDRAGERVAAFQLTVAEGVYGIAGKADPSAWLTGLPLDALGNDVAVVANGTFAENIADGTLAIAGRAIRANGKGAFDLSANAFRSFDLKARLTDPELFGDSLSLRDTTLAAELDGSLRDLEIAHVLEIGELQSGDILVAGLSQTGTATYDGTRFVLPMNADIARVTTGTELVDPRLVDGSVGGQLVYSGNRLLSDDFAINFPGLSANLALRGDLDSGVVALAGPVEADRLRLDDLGDVDVVAKIIFKAGGNLPWTLQANLAGRLPRVTNATLADLAGDNIRFRGGVTVGAEQPVRFRDAVLTASKLRLNVNGRLDGGRTSLAGGGTHTEYGDFTVDGSLGPDGPRAVLVFANPLPAAGLRDVRVALSPIDNGFALDTEGQSTLGPFDGQINLFSSPGGPTRLAIQRLEVWKTMVTGDVTLGDGGATGTLALAGGGLDGTIAIVPRGGGQAFDIDVVARNARFAGATPIAIRQGTIRASGLLVDGNSTIEGSARGAGITYGNLFIGRFAGKASLRNGAGDFTASLAGRRGSRFDLQLTGDVAPERIAVVARGQYAGRRITMPRRAVITKLDDGGWSLSPTQISFGKGGAIAQGRFGGATTDIDLQLANMPLSLIDATGAELGLGGTISGKVDYVARAGALPSGEAKVKIEGLSRSGLVLSSRPIDVALVGRLTPSKLTARAVVEEAGSGNTSRGRLQAQITNLPSSGSLIDRINRGALRAQLRYNGPADALWRLAAIETFDLTGPLQVAANATGTLQNPRVTGSLASDDLRVRSALTGTDIRSLRARGSFAGSVLRLTSFRGNDGKGGTVSGSGTVDISGLGPRGPKIDLRIAANDAQIVNRPDMAATISGPLRIVSSGIGGTIAGRVEIEKARWRLGTADEEVRLPSIATREVNGRPDIAPVRQRFQPWRFLINAKGNNRIDVRGLGLDSEWGADIRLRGTTDDPRIGGKAEVVRGGYSFAGTRFELTKGLIDFDQNVPIDPRIDVEAEARVTGLTVTAAVRGNAQQPEITFSSVPALPEDEILARLLFGGSITNLSATDALQLGAALASLRGGGGMDPINKLRTAIGLDRLRIVPADPAIDRGTSVALGKNFGRKFYAEIITDGQGYSASEVEFRVTSWLSLLAAVSTIGRESVSAEVSKDY